MSAATTILFAREDLSIPGSAEAGIPGRDRLDSVQAHFFDLISRSSPDVIVLDFSRAPAAGANTILTVRRRTDVPILVVCSPEQLENRGLPHCRRSGLHCRAGRHRQLEPNDTTDRGGQRPRQEGVAQSPRQFPLRWSLLLSRP
jgi:hypothetical protein